MKHSAETRAKISRGKVEASRRARENEVPLDKKKCTKCGKYKTADEFSKVNHTLRDGTPRQYLKPVCKKCDAARLRRYIRNLPPEVLKERRKRTGRRYKERHPERVREANAAYRAKKRQEAGLPPKRKRVDGSPQITNRRLPAEPFRKWLNEQSKSVEEVARAAGVDPTGLVNIANGKRPRVTLAYADRVLTRNGNQISVTTLWPDE
jgi:hypothetical protein